jgi:hypothetical protein
MQKAGSLSAGSSYSIIKRAMIQTHDNSTGFVLSLLKNHNTRRRHTARPAELSGCYGKPMVEADVYNRHAASVRPAEHSCRPNSGKLSLATRIQEER